MTHRAPTPAAHAVGPPAGIAPGATSRPGTRPVAVAPTRRRHTTGHTVSEREEDTTSPQVPDPNASTRCGPNVYSEEER